MMWLAWAESMNNAFLPSRTAKMRCLVQFVRNQLELLMGYATSMLLQSY